MCISTWPAVHEYLKLRSRCAKVTLATTANMRGLEAPCAGASDCFVPIGQPGRGRCGREQSFGGYGEAHRVGSGAIIRKEHDAYLLEHLYSP